MFESPSAGRSQEKLDRVRAELPAAAAEWPTIVADSSDPDSIARMAATTTGGSDDSGPLLPYGMPLVEACADAGTHYADLTGETLFMRRSIDAADERAGASGARIVHTCGFDSIPSDIGVMLLAEHAAATGAGDLEATTLVVRSMRGGVAGGTVDSMRGQLDAGKADKSLRRVMLDPYALSPTAPPNPISAPSATRWEWCTTRVSAAGLRRS